VTSLAPTWATATGWSTVEDWVGAQLSSRWGTAGAADYDQDGLCAEVRDVVNDNLPTGWTLDENQFVGPTHSPRMRSPSSVMRSVRSTFGRWRSTTTTVTESQALAFCRSSVRHAYHFRLATDNAPYVSDGTWARG
jgi:hypothetical protein